MKAAQQIKRAKTLGKLAYEKGIMRSPSQDSEINEMLAGRKVGETPKSEARTTLILDVWNHAWIRASLAGCLRS